MLRAAMACCFIETQPIASEKEISDCFLECDQIVVKRSAIDKSSAHAAKPPCGCGFWDGTQLIIPASTCTSGQKTRPGPRAGFVALPFCLARP